MTRNEARRIVIDTTTAWAQDPDSDVVWAGEYEGRWGIRMAQQCRDFSTVWFEIGERTVRFEAYLLPAPDPSAAESFRFCLARNWRSWPAAIAIDTHGDIFVAGRIALERLSAASLDEAVGAVYETVELSFRPLLRLGRAGHAR